MWQILTDKTFLSIVYSLHVFTCHLVQSANTEFLLMKTCKVLNRSSKCANVRFSKIIIKTEKIQHTIFETFTKESSLRNLTRFHGRRFELKILEILTTAFLLKTIT